jgi:MFS family permease
MVSLMGITSALVPHFKKLWTLYFNFWLYGLGCGAWNNANNVWLIEMWQQNSAPVLQLSQFVFGIGSILGPLIAKPYLTGEPDLTLNRTDSLSSTKNTFFTTSIVHVIDRRSKLKTPFITASIIQMIGIYYKKFFHYILN